MSVSVLFDGSGLNEAIAGNTADGWKELAKVLIDNFNTYKMEVQLQFENSLKTEKFASCDL